MATNNPFATPALSHFYGGAIPTPPSDQDFVLPHLARPKVTAYTNHDLRAYRGQSLCLPVRDQGRLGKCTGMAWSGLRAAAAAKWHIDTNTTPDLGDAISGSFIYDMERRYTMTPPTWPQDSGADMRAGGLVLSKYGAAPDRYYPETERADAPPPSQDALDAALYYGVSTFFRLQGPGATLVSSGLACLDEGWPFVIAILVEEPFERIGSDGRVPGPNPNSAILGGHAVLVVGDFVDNSFPGGGCWIVQNSWGTGYGDGGYCYIPFAYMTTQHRQYGYYCSEGWTIR
jgi:hypothetical protein